MINTTPVDTKSLNPYASDREQIINRAIDHLKKELQTIDDEHDLSYDELVYITKRIGFYTSY